MTEKQDAEKIATKKQAAAVATSASRSQESSSLKVRLTDGLKKWFTYGEKQLIDALNLEFDSEELMPETVIALDCMGGDHSPTAALEAVDLLTRTHIRARYLLCGRCEQLEPFLLKAAKKNPRILQQCTVKHCETVIAGDEKPVAALRHGKDSSMRIAIDSVAAGEADACVSAGNTGALMAISKVVMRSLAGIDRPAIVAAIPTVQGRTTFLLDMGANLECDARNLCEFAIMGRAFAMAIKNLAEPTVGLLNLGTEEIKGNEAIKLAAQILRQSEFSQYFHGYVEGDDIAKGTVDVVVADGFSGNVALKAIEGTAKLISHLVKRAFSDSVAAKFGAVFACRALRDISRTADPRLYNGGMLLGLNGICVKSHGNSDCISLANAIKIAILLSRRKINESIKQELCKIDLSIGNHITQ